MDPVSSFQRECEENVARMATDPAVHDAAQRFLHATHSHKYTYNFRALGRPIIQLPQDMVALQELIWATRPDLIIETGIAHGGSLMLSAGMLALLDYCDAAHEGRALDPRQPRRRVIGIDIDIRAHNRAAIEGHPLRYGIDLVQGSSIEPDVVTRVRAMAAGHERVMVCLDSNHTHAHVLAELEAYADLVTIGGYCCVFDTIIEDLPPGLFPDRPWDRGDNPKTAVHAYLRGLEERPRLAVDGRSLHYEIDRSVQDKLGLTVAPDGYLRRVA